METFISPSQHLLSQLSYEHYRGFGAARVTQSLQEIANKCLHYNTCHTFYIALRDKAILHEPPSIIYNPHNHIVQPICPLETRERCLRTQSLCASQITHLDSRFWVRCGDRKDAEPPICLLINRNIVWQSSKEVHLPFNPPENLFGRCEEFQVSKTDFILLARSWIAEERHLQRYPTARPQRWPRKLVLLTRTVMKTASTNGVVHVGTWTVPTLKCGFVRYVLIASIPRSRNTHKL